MVERKKKTKTQNITMTFRLPEELRDNFNQLCIDKNLNASEILRDLIAQWIEEQLNKDIEKKRTTDI